VDNLSFGFSWSVNTDINITGMKLFNKDVNLNSDVNVNSPANAAAPANLPTKGFTFVAKDPSGIARAVITALAEESKAKVLASPHILVSDNREARIQVGSEVPLTTSQTSTTAVAGTVPSITSTVQYKDIGIILKVKPQVNDSGLIMLELSQEVSTIGKVTVDVGGLKNITIDKIEATSNLVAQDGETIIIGGLIREDSTKGQDGIPYLSKIPIIGHLFGNTNDETTRTELIILLSPRVIKNRQEAKGVTSEYTQRLKGVSKEISENESSKNKLHIDQSGAVDSSNK
jgi:general secretion pathway protein D